MKRFIIAGVLALAATTPILTPMASAKPNQGWKKDRADNAADRIERAFRNDRWLKSAKIDVDDKRDYVVLKGWVKSQRQRTHAISLAQRTAPRVRIDSQWLRVR